MTTGAGQNDVEAKVRELVGRLAKLEPGFSGAADLYKELGMKSAAGLELLMAMEEEFAITLSDEAFGDARTVEKLVALVESARAAA